MLAVLLLARARVAACFCAQGYHHPGTRPCCISTVVSVLPITTPCTVLLKRVLWCTAVLPQDIFNLLPNMNVEALSTSLAVKGNDMMAVIYLASLIRSVLALHRLIDNKEQRMWSVSCLLSVSTRVCSCRCVVVDGVVCVVLPSFSC